MTAGHSDKGKKLVMGGGRFELRDLPKTCSNYVTQEKIAYSLSAAFKCRNYGSQVLQLAILITTTSMLFLITFHLFKSFFYS